MSEKSDVIGKDSRYNRPRSPISWAGLLVGVALGISLGLYYTWIVNPVVEVDTRPEQLERQAQGRYMAAIALSFADTSDLQRAIDRLLTVTRSRDPFQDMADIACEMVQTGHINTTAGFREVRSMVTFYQLQGRSSCADEAIMALAPPTQELVVVLPTPTEAPPATKTPTVAPQSLPTATIPIFVPTTPPRQQFVLVNVATFCEVEASGIIEVFVQDFNGTGIPGQPVRVRWEGGEDTFFTGLKPERGAAYADFTMTDGETYSIEMPDRSEPSTRQLAAVPCTTEDGQSAITSYRAVFRPAG